MSRDRVFGAIVLVVSVVGIVVYGWLLYAFPTIVLQITAFVAVGLVLAIAAWIGGVMATTPSPAPLEPETTATTVAAETKTEVGR